MKSSDTKKERDLTKTEVLTELISLTKDGWEDGFDSADVLHFIISYLQLLLMEIESEQTGKDSETSL